MLRTILRTAATTTTPCNKATRLSLYSTSATQAEGQQLSQKKRLLKKDILVTPDEDGMRIDRFIRHKLAQDPDWPPVNNVVVSKWLRKRQVRLLAPLPTATTATASDGPELAEGAILNIEGLFDKAQTNEKVKIHASTATRTETGQLWRVRGIFGVSPSTEATGPVQLTTSGRSSSSHRETTATTSIPHLPLENWVIYKDERIIAINKPSGISVQGGTGVTASIDSSLSVLQYDYPEKPRLVHRLDKTTSGLFIVARTRKAAQDLSMRFQGGAKAVPDNSAEISMLQKKYIAIVSSTCRVKDPHKRRKQDSGSEPFRLQGDMLMMTNGKTQTIRISPSKKITNTFAAKSVWPSVTDVVIAAESSQSGILKAPILGDVKYSSAEMKADDGITSRIYLHMAELELKGWFASAEHQKTRTSEGGGYRVTKDGSLVLTAKLESDMERTIERLGLSQA
ncbi:hypothetical protein EC991_000424 [Linnemannia zychae]|nr:hypothetical protein EC991_000424 [Linnemannia zychae]